MDLAPGTILGDGQYQISRRIHVGRTREVWSAVRLTRGQRVVIKALVPTLAGEPLAVVQLMRETGLLSEITSDHVAPVWDLLPDERRGPLMVMGFVQGRPLQEVLREAPLGVEEILDLGEQLARALVDIHAAGVVHRDVRPENIIMKSGPDGRARPVLINCTMGARVDEPEAAAPQEDIHAVGGILLRAAMGLPELPLMLSRVVDRMVMSSSPGRFSTAEELLAELRAIG